MPCDRNVLEKVVDLHVRVLGREVVGVCLVVGGVVVDCVVPIVPRSMLQLTRHLLDKFNS